MKRARWVLIPLDVTLAIHDEQIAEHGGIGGVRDIAVIDSALARPHHLLAYEKPDSAALAACYAFGLCGSHGFYDGNKRTAYVVAEVFLDLNGYAIGASDESVVTVMLRVASGSMTEGQLAEWFRSVIARSD